MEQSSTHEELEQMRSQIEILKKKISEEEIVNRKVLRNAMKKNIRNFNNDSMIINIVAITAMPCSGYILLDAGFSRWFSCGTIIFFAVCIIKNLIQTRGMRTSTIMNDNLVVAGEKVVNAKERHIKSLKIMIPFLTLWLIWFFTEVIIMAKDDTYALGFACGGALGGIIGGIIGFRKHRKTICTLDEIISQIEALQKED